MFVGGPAHDVRIFTPTEELALAGHPLVGTAWLLTGGEGAIALRPPAGVVEASSVEGLTWIRARAEWAPGYELRQLG